MPALNARSLIGHAVVSVADGEKVGAISDVLVDLARRAILGLLIGGDGGPFNREKPSLIPFNTVHTFGRDAVTIGDKTGITAPAGTPYDSADTLAIIKKPVVTADGDEIGDGDDLIFEESSGAVTALQLAPQGGFLGIGATTHVLPIAEVVEFGPDVITVHESALARIRPEASSK